MIATPYLLARPYAGARNLSGLRLDLWGPEIGAKMLMLPRKPINIEANFSQAWINGKPLTIAGGSLGVMIKRVELRLGGQMFRSEWTTLEGVKVGLRVWLKITRPLFAFWRSAMKHQLVSGFLKTAAFVTLSLQLTGCAADSPLGILFHPPECSITSIEKQDGAFAKTAKIVMTVENTGGSATAYNVGCIIKLKTGNTIIETSSADFGTLKSGEAAIGVAAFSRIEKHSEYGDAEYKLYWYDAEDGYYEK